MSEDSHFLNKIAEEAAAILSSDKRSNLKNRILALAPDTQPPVNWQTQIFYNILYRMFSEYSELQRAFEAPNSQIELIAWRSRNLLEISIWTYYCCDRKENARRFYEDIGRDTLNIINSFSTWAKKTDDAESINNSIAKGHKSLLDYFEKNQLSIDDDDYTKIHDAAKLVGMEKDFRIGYKFLSKWAHPTATSMMPKSDISVVIQMKHAFYTHGATCFLGAFHRLDKFIAYAPTVT